MIDNPRGVATPHDLRRATRHLVERDPVMAGLVAAVGPCRWIVEPSASPFAALAQSILYQQITGKAAESIHRRVQALAGRGRLRPRHIAEATDGALRGCGLSRQKIASLRDLAQKGAHWRHARLSRLDDEAVIETLTEVKGVGRWTAEMFLIFRLGRPDVLPVDDYGIRKAMQRAYRMRALPKPDRMRKVAERWRPYRTVACWYLWKSLARPAARQGEVRPSTSTDARPGRTAAGAARSSRPAAGARRSPDNARVPGRSRPVAPGPAVRRTSAA